MDIQTLELIRNINFYEGSERRRKNYIIFSNLRTINRVCMQRMFEEKNDILDYVYRNDLEIEEVPMFQPLRTLSSGFIEKFKGFIDWGALIENFKLTLEEVIKYRIYFNDDDISRCQFHIFLNSEKEPNFFNKSLTYYN